MIAQLGKHLRKWLLGLAVAARNQAQAIVAKMESVEAEAAEGAGRRAAPGAAQTARSGQPPAHWVRLVERHAPELLVPGPPYAVPRASSQVFETDPGRDESVGVDAQDPPSVNRAIAADEAQTREDPAFPVKLPRLSRKHGAPPGRRPSPTPDEKRPTGDSERPPEAAVRPHRNDAAPHRPEAASAGSAKVHRTAESDAGAEETTRRRFLRLQPNASPVDPGAPEPGTPNTETPVAWTPAARRFRSADGRIEKNRPAHRESQNILSDTPEDFQPPSRTGKDVGSFDRQTEDRPAGYQTAAGAPAFPAIKQETAYEKRPRPNESSKGRTSLSDVGFKTSAPPINKSGDDLGHVNEFRPSSGQSRAQPAEERVKVDEKRSRPPEFHWPDLPGEKSSEAAGDLNLGATWPSLPQAPSAAAASWRPQPETHLWEAGSRTSERLRRLDEEQRGVSWSALLF
jgi:hypothetical protein